MDYVYLSKEIDRNEELWDKEFSKRKAVGKAQKWLWEGLNYGFKFAMETMRDIIKHGEELGDLIDRCKRLTTYKTTEQEEIEHRAKIEVLEEVLNGMRENVIHIGTAKEMLKELEDMLINPIGNKLKELQNE